MNKRNGWKFGRLLKKELLVLIICYAAILINPLLKKSFVSQAISSQNNIKLITIKLNYPHRNILEKNALADER